MEAGDGGRRGLREGCRGALQIEQLREDDDSMKLSIHCQKRRRLFDGPRPVKIRVGIKKQGDATKITKTKQLLRDA
jgi:hypothetical protein